jgi:hypothetical protein
MESLESLVNNNLNLIHNVIKKYFKIKKDNYLYEEYYLEGRLALVKAAQKRLENTDHKGQFSTLATIYIFNAIGNLASCNYNGTNIKYTNKNKKHTLSQISLDLKYKDTDTNLYDTLMANDEHKQSLDMILTDDDVFKLLYLKDRLGESFYNLVLKYHDGMKNIEEAKKIYNFTEHELSVIQKRSLNNLIYQKTKQDRNLKKEYKSYANKFKHQLRQEKGRFMETI